MAKKLPKSTDDKKSPPEPLDARAVLHAMQGDLQAALDKKNWPNTFFVVPTAKSQTIVETCLLMTLARLHPDRERLVAMLIETVSAAADSITDDDLANQVMTSCFQAVNGICEQR